jgi:hypothetical protein
VKQMDSLKSYAGWPDWSNFCPFCDCLLWTFFDDYICSSNFLVTIYHRKINVIILSEMGWAAIWAFLYKLIWSSWSHKMKQY